MLHCLLGEWFLWLWKYICRTINSNVLIFRASELPNDVKKVSDSGLKINFHRQELIEDCMKSKNISFDAICGKCIVFKAYENGKGKKLMEIVLN